jgi:hypothetical protein
MKRHAVEIPLANSHSRGSTIRSPSERAHSSTSAGAMVAVTGIRSRKLDCAARAGCANAVETSRDDIGPCKSAPAMKAAPAIASTAAGRRTIDLPWAGYKRLVMMFDLLSGVTTRWRANRDTRFILPEDASRLVFVTPIPSQSRRCHKSESRDVLRVRLPLASRPRSQVLSLRKLVRARGETKPFVKGRP